MSTAAAFWSYVHSDDKNSYGQVRQLANLIEREFELLSAERLQLFLDNDSLEWGAVWKDRIDGALQLTTFFIPVITPAFFASQACRDELRQFLEVSRQFASERLVLPILFAKTPDLGLDSADELKREISRVQYVDWTQLRLEEPDSSLHRKAVNLLAERLIDAAASLETAVEPAEPEVVPGSPVGSEAIAVGLGSPVGDRQDLVVAQGDEDEDEDEAPGLLDLMATLEPAMDAWSNTLNAFQKPLDEFTTVLTEAAAPIEEASKPGKPVAARLIAFRNTANAARPSAEQIQQLGLRYIKELDEMDPMFRASIQLMALNPKEHIEDLKSVRGLVVMARGVTEQLGDVADTAKKYSNLSRDLRPVFRMYEDGLRNVVDGQRTMDEWSVLVDEAMKELD